MISLICFGCVGRKTNKEKHKEITQREREKEDDDWLDLRTEKTGIYREMRIARKNRFQKTNREEMYKHKDTHRDDDDDDDDDDVANSMG